MKKGKGIPGKWGAASKRKTMGRRLGAVALSFAAGAAMGAGYGTPIAYAESVGGEITVEEISASKASETLGTKVRFENGSGTAELTIRVKSGSEVVSEDRETVKFAENEVKSFTFRLPSDYASGGIEITYSPRA